MKKLFENLKLIRRVNWVMMAAVVLLMSISVAFIYSSCFVSEEDPVRMLWVKQIVWGVAGMGCCLFMTMYDYRNLSKIAPWLYWVGIFLLILVLFAGVTIYGARRWLRIYGPLGIQPSELAKIATMFMLARFLSRPNAQPDRFSEVVKVLAMAMVPLLLILKEPDLGSGMLLLPLAFVMMFVAGVSFKFLGSLAGAGILAVLIILGAVMLPERLGIGEEGQVRILKMAGLKEYHKLRIEAFFQPGKDPLGSGWSKMQSEIAVGSGGPWGKGFNKGTQKRLGFLPRSVAPTDFIYSVVAEEKGFMGSVVILFLYGVVITCGIQAAIIAEDLFGRLLCTGVVTLIFCHVFINMAMTIGLLPITGIPLPLMSYGGSFMIITMFGLGVIQSVHVRSCPMVQRFLYDQSVILS